MPASTNPSASTSTAGFSACSGMRSRTSSGSAATDRGSSCMPTTRFRSIRTRSTNSLHLSKPVRSLLLDSRGTLWFATKGEGIIQIPHFSTSRKPTDFEQINGPDSGLSDHAVFALEESERGLSDRFRGVRHQLPVVVGRCGGPWAGIPPDLRYIHAIRESHRDTLWVATVGCGGFPAAARRRGATPHVREWKKLDSGRALENKRFFSRSSRMGPYALDRGIGAGPDSLLPAAGQLYGDDVCRFCGRRSPTTWAILRGRTDGCDRH